MDAFNSVCRFLATPIVLRRLFFLNVALMVAFWMVMKIWDFTLIDEMFKPSEIRSHVEEMSTTQRKVHIWTTATLDVAFPFAYGGFFIGTGVRFPGRSGPLLIIPSVLCIAVDLIEGFVQVNILANDMTYLTAKEWVTPLKLILFVACLIITLFAWAREFRSHTHSHSA